MNPEEEVPTRVTRGALRRRSIDQEATPQKPPTTGATSAAGATPKKTASTTKKAPALGAILESEGRPSTPLGSRVSRRRISESVDTPITASNKLVQILKDSESVGGSGRPSRNTSLTEENILELNAASEGTGTVTRIRTPARLRASQETLASTTPQTAPPAVRRSTRRNSVTSDDGASSVQSLPITTPKTPILRSIKAETITEEDISEDRAESVTSESSVRSTRPQSNLPKAASQSPRGEATSPVSIIIRNEMTPPHGSKSSSIRLTTPRSKNVSFTDDAKQEDSQSAYPKTPTSPGTKYALVELNDLRNTQLISGSPKANVEIKLNGAGEKLNSARKVARENGSPKDTAHEANKSPTIEAVGPTKDNGSKAVSPSPAKVISSQPSTASKLNTSNIPVAERSVNVASNDESGIEALESSDLEEVDTSAANVSGSQKMNETASPHIFSNSWNSSVRGTNKKGIDAFSVRKQEEEKAEAEKEQLNASQMVSTKPGKTLGKKKEEFEEEDLLEDTEEELNESTGNEFVDEEAMEVDGYQSGDSLDSETRQEMADNEIVERGEDIGSEDTEDEDADELDGEDENDSFIVSDGEEMVLLEDSEDEMLLDADSPEKAPQVKGPARRRIVQMTDDSDDGKLTNEKSKPTVDSDENSPKSARLSSSFKRSARPRLTSEVESSPEKKSNSSKSEAGNRSLSETPTRVAVPLANETPSKANESASKSATPKRTPLKQQHEDVETVFSLDVSTKNAKKQNEAVSEATSNRQDLNDETVSSRKSLPAGSAKIGVESSKTISRKSLPASTKMQFVEEVATEELQPSLSNLEASFGDEDEVKDEQALEQSAMETPFTEKSTEQKEQVKDDEKLWVVSVSDRMSASNASTEEEFFEATAEDAPIESPAADQTEEQPAPQRPLAPAKPARKSLPVASLISAQFYLGGAKKEKRHTIAGDDGAIGATSTPNQKPSTKKNAGSTLVVNPFALSTAKAEDQKSTKIRTSLNLNPEQQPEQQQTMPEPEPMEVDEYDELVVEETGGEKKQDVSLGTEEKVAESLQTKPTAAKKTKALEDYDMESILSRCNEVVRAVKERKKQCGTALQQRKDEKRRLRELREQTLKEEQQRRDANDDGSDGTTTNYTTTTGNESQEAQEAAKKKNKKKKKVKNYVLEELTEIRKDRVAAALQRKLEMNQLRKERQKERRLAKEKLGNKENKDEVGSAQKGAVGIGAKLLKAQREKQRKKGEKAAAAAADANKPVPEVVSKHPAVRVEVSAFAVFQELQNNRPKPNLVPAKVVSADGETKNSSEAPVVENKAENQPAKAKKSEKPSKENQQPAVVVVAKALTADDVVAAKKRPEENSSQPAKKSSSEGQLPPKLINGKPKRQPESVKSSAAEVLGSSDVTVREQEPPHEEKLKAKKQLKNRAEKMSASTEEPRDDKKVLLVSSVVPSAANENYEPAGKQKKGKKKAMPMVNTADTMETMIGKALREVHAAFEQTGGRKKQDKKAVEQELNVLGQGATSFAPAVAAAANPPKKRKRELSDGNQSVSTPRPTKLRALQRADHTFVEETVTPEKTRLKRNFGFQEQQATPKTVGFKVSSLLPTEELRTFAMGEEGAKGKHKSVGMIAEPRRVLPLPVWTSSGYFFETPDEQQAAAPGRAVHSKGGKKKSKTLGGASDDSVYIALKGHEGFQLKTLRATHQGASSRTVPSKPHQIDPDVIGNSAVSFKRQQLLDRTAHLREKKGHSVGRV